MKGGRQRGDRGRTMVEEGKGLEVREEEGRRKRNGDRNVEEGEKMEK